MDLNAGPMGRPSPGPERLRAQHWYNAAQCPGPWRELAGKGSSRRWSEGGGQVCVGPARVVLATRGALVSVPGSLVYVGLVSPAGRAGLGQTDEGLDREAT